MTITYKQAHLRNLKIKILKILIEKKGLESNFDGVFEDSELRTDFYFQKNDLLKYKADLFSENKVLKIEIQEELAEFKRLHYSILQNEIYANEVRFKELYKEMEEAFRNFKYDDDLISKNMGEISEFVEQLHWFYLPIYEEEFILNRELLPESNLRDFYSHYHAIEDLYRWIIKHPQSVDWKSLAGDLNLNKEIDFKVYTSRWGHYDKYSISRTIEGWKFSSMRNEVECKIDGSSISNTNEEQKFETGIYSSLKHDNVQYPKEGVAHALTLLWNDANSIEMSIEVLQKKMEEITEWISAVEKVTHDKQPSWCNYY